MMLVGFGGTDSEPYMMPIGGILDQNYLPGPIAKDRLEDLQLWSILQALASYEGSKHPLAVRPGDDPPDRIITHGGRSWATELTELTLEDIRGDLARVRAAGRLLEEHLRDRSSKYSFLQGRTVMLAKHPDQQLPRNIGAILDKIEASLLDDKGFVGQEPVSAQGTPRGYYGMYGPFSITVNQTSQGGPVVVSSTSQVLLFRHEVIDAFQARVRDKDKPENEIVFISCGLPDKQGYACPSDHAVFTMLREALDEGIDITPPLRHLRGGLVHLWGTDRMFAWGDGEDFPWSNCGVKLSLGKSAP